ncbi:MAG: hypothetical protein JKY88_18885 [Pseudomonadales bacterium]|nr:hypothetical protein [Pseudomonadales bacterium]
MKIFKISFLFFIFSQNLMAEDVFHNSLVGSIQGSGSGRITEGQIRSIDLVNRTAIISGFIYHFGPATDAQPLQVRMLGKDYGSLEMLKVDMHVEVIYIQEDQHRVGKKLTQINESEET